jgi:glycerophosphoryl diester phosphodiesterase
MWGVSAQSEETDFMVIAHRGYSSVAPENTLSAIEEAVEIGANHVEVDVHLTRDGEVVVIHDKSIDRTTNGAGRVEDLTLKQLKTYDAGGWFSPAYQGETIPTLDEVFQAVPRGTKIIVEIKEGRSRYQGVEEKIISLADVRGRRGDIILKAFNEDILDTAEQLAPDIPRLLVYVFGFGVDSFSGEFLQHHRWFLDRRSLNRLQSADFKVIVWHVNDRDDMQRLVDWGVDGIETDHPNVLLDVLRDSGWVTRNSY